MMRGMETAIGPKSSLRSQSVRRLKFPGRNDAMLTRKRRPGGGKQFSKQKSELVQKVRSRGKGTGQVQTSLCEKWKGNE